MDSHTRAVFLPTLKHWDSKTDYSLENFSVGLGTYFSISGLQMLRLTEVII